MKKFFRVKEILVDVERGLIMDNADGKQIEINITNFTMKSSPNRVKLNPIRIDTENGKPQLLWWNDRVNRWTSFEKTHGADIYSAVQMYINIKFEEELLG